MITTSTTNSFTPGQISFIILVFILLVLAVVLVIVSSNSKKNNERRNNNNNNNSDIYGYYKKRVSFQLEDDDQENFPSMSGSVIGTSSMSDASPYLANPPSPAPASNPPAAPMGEPKKSNEYIDTDITSAFITI